MNDIGFVIIAFLIVCFVGFLLVDRVGLDTHYGKGYMTKKEYHPEYETESCSDAGDVEICNDVVHPERWEITVNYKGETSSIDVSEKFYESSVISQDVNIGYQKGRITGSLFI